MREPLVSAIAKRRMKRYTVQMELRGEAKRRNAAVPEMAATKRTMFFGNRSPSQPVTRDSGTVTKSSSPKILAAVCCSTPFHTMMGMMCSITPDLAVRRRKLPNKSIQ